ncbi:hypothetical protein FRC07_000502 [Ceratobasidium sp. 392]|nr:hypothetical protein FRC07_000502 [Ceratobasidium sp. 392]
MAQFVAGLLGITLAEAGKAVGLAAVSAITTKAFNLIFSGPSTQLDAGNQEVLQEFRTDLQALRTRIADIGEGVKALQLNVKTDLVRGYIGPINALSEQYWSAIDAMADAASLQPSKEKDLAYDSARKRSIKLGQRVTDEIYVNVKQMHTFLSGQGSQSLLALLNAQELDDCDFYAYFCRMKTHLLNYWAIEIKALSLLEFVQTDPGVDFTDGPGLIKNVNAKILAQEKFVDNLIPQSVAQLVTAFRKDESKTGKVNIKFQFQEDKYIIGTTFNGGFIKGCPADQATAKPWTLQAANPLSDLDMNADHYFSLNYDGLPLVFTSLANAPADGRLDVQTSNLELWKGIRWKVRPSGGGKFRLESMREPPNNQVDHHCLCTVSRDGGQWLGKADKLNASDPAQLFIIKVA